MATNRMLFAPLMCVTLMTGGCSSISTSRPGSFASLFDNESAEREAEAHRSRYQQSRSPVELQWLMRNCVESGMTPAEINRVIGEQGQRVYDDDWIKTRGGHYHSSDNTWKWGPDREGNSVYLVFRENRLVNFDPDEFASMSVPE